MLKHCLFIAVMFTIIVVSLCIFHKGEKYVDISSSVRGSRFDPEIALQSGGMSSYSSAPYDTNQDLGFINYPYYSADYPTYNPDYPFYQADYYPRSDQTNPKNFYPIDPSYYVLNRPCKN